MFTGSSVMRSLLFCSRKALRGEKRTRANAQTRGLHNENELIPEAQRRIAAQTCIDVELILRQIAKFVLSLHETKLSGTARYYPRPGSQSGCTMAFTPPAHTS